MSRAKHTSSSANIAGPKDQKQLVLPISSAPHNYLSYLQK